VVSPGADNLSLGLARHANSRVNRELPGHECRASHKGTTNDKDNGVCGRITQPSLDQGRSRRRRRRTALDDGHPLGTIYNIKNNLVIMYANRTVRQTLDFLSHLGRRRFRPTEAIPAHNNVIHHIVAKVVGESTYSATPACAATKRTVGEHRRMYEQECS
jgi:hypothetical protein